MEHDITPALTGAFIRRASGKGYQVQLLELQTDPKLCMAAFINGQELCRFETSGAMRYYQDNPYEKERKELHALLLSMKQAHDLYANAKPLICDGVQDFRLISEFGDYLLAATLDKNHEVRFVTWSYSYDHTGVTLGHYYETDYEGARTDYALRAGLIDKNQLFSKEELAALYSACLFQGQHDDTLKFENGKLLDAVTEKIQDCIPEILVSDSDKWQDRQQAGYQSEQEGGHDL